MVLTVRTDRLTCSILVEVSYKLAAEKFNVILLDPCNLQMYKVQTNVYTHVS